MNLIKRTVPALMACLVSGSVNGLEFEPMTVPGEVLELARGLEDDDNRLRQSGDISREERAALNKKLMARLEAEGLTKDNGWLQGRLIRGGHGRDVAWPYSERAFPYTWDFSDHSLHGAETGDGIVNPRIENGVLMFGVEKNASFSYYSCNVFLLGESGRKMDASSRGENTPFGARSMTAVIQATPIAARPSLRADATFESVRTNDTVTARLPDLEANGIAIHSLSGTHGVWEYLLDGGATWNRIEEVAEDKALLLGAFDRLRFSVGSASTDSAHLSWGNMNPEKAGLLFGYNQGEYPAAPLSSIAVRLRQSLPESKWNASVKRLQGDRETGRQVFHSETATLRGSDWQILTLPFDPRVSVLHPPFTGVRIETSTTGNEIEVDWVEPRAEQRRIYRKTIKITSPVRWAKASLSGNGFSRLLINGKTAAESPPANKSQAIWNFELDPDLFQQGKNVIGLESSVWRAGMVLLDGALLCEDGSYIRFDSDTSWKYKDNWTEDDAPWKGLWARPDHEDSGGWRPVFEGHSTAEQPEDNPSKFWFNPSWKGQLMVRPADGRDQPVFGSREAVALRVAVPEREGETREVTWQVFDVMGDGFRAYDTLVAEGTLALVKGTDLRAALPGDHAGVLHFPAGTLALNRAYAVVFRLAIDGEPVERYRYELAVVGPVEQPTIKNPQHYTDGMDLNLVWELDAADENMIPALPAAPAPAPAPATANDWLFGEVEAPQPDEGWAKHADFISCNGIGEPVPSTIVETPLGRFRRTDIERNDVSSTGGGPASYISFKYTLENPGRPHVAIAEYPSDTIRCQEMRLDEAFPAGTTHHAGGAGTTVLGNHSALIGYESPLLHEIMHHHVVFFPSETTGTVTFYGIGGVRDAWRPEHAARVGRIRIYEILNDLPARLIQDAPGKRKRLGQQHEAGPRQVMQSNLVSPVHAYFRTHLIAGESPLFYRNWLITCMNQIKRMRFAGENAFYAGQFMYTHPLYPSEYSDATAFGHNYSGSLKDYGVLMARMFEENDLALYSGIEMAGIHRLQLGCSDDDVARGVDTLSQISRTGEQRTFLGRGSIYPNWIRPEVRKYFETVMRELIALYAGEKGWKGIQLQVNEVLGPTWADERCSDPWFSSYDDWTMALFEKETGVKLPSRPSKLSAPSDKSDKSDLSGIPDPDRFAKRYRWLMDHADAKQKWTRWRADKMTELYQWLAAELKAARPDLELVFFPQSVSFMIPEIGEKPGDALPSPFDYSLRGGLDLETIKESPDMALAMNVQCAVDVNGLLSGRRTTKSRYWSRTDRFITPFSNDGLSGITVRYNWYEAQPSSPPGWVWDYSGTETWMWGEDRYFGDYWVNVFVRSNPAFILHSLMDCTVWMGREWEMSRFAHAFRTLPAAEYTRLTGSGRDRNVWMQTAVYDGDLYGYIANAQWWGVRADIKFRAGAQVTDLINSTQIDAGTWNVDLPPYTIRTFRVQGTDSRDVIESCAAVVSQQGQRATERLLAVYREFHGENTGELAATGDKTALDEMMEKAAHLLETGEYAGAFDLLMLFPAKSNLVLEPDPATGWGERFTVRLK